MSTMCCPLTRVAITHMVSNSTPTIDALDETDCSQGDRMLVRYVERRRQEQVADAVVAQLGSLRLPSGMTSTPGDDIVDGTRHLKMVIPRRIWDMAEPLTPS